MEEWKQAIGDKALQLGLLKDPDLLGRLDEPVPLWVILELMLQLRDTIDPPYASYD